MGDLELRRLYREATSDPTVENLARLGAAYIRLHNMPSKLRIFGRRWFSKGRGHTYHSVSVYLNDQHLGNSGVVPGSGNHYLYTGRDIAIDSGALPPQEGGNETLWRWTERLNLELEDNVTNVSRRRDLLWQHRH